MRRLFALLFAALALSANVPIHPPKPQHNITFNPNAPTVPCDAPGGTFVANLVLTGIDPTSLVLSGDTTDFVLSGPQIVVATGGITSPAARCPLATNVTVIVTVTGQ
jgi:hypothetical protein